MKNLVLALSILLVSLQAASLAQADEPTRKVLIVGVDGMRADALDVARTPVLDGLRQEGCWTDQALTGVVTVSGPGWSSLLTGVWMDKHGCRSNSFKDVRYDRYPHFFARLKERRPQAFTASIVDWLPIDRLILGETGADFRFAHDYEDDGDTKMVAKAVEVLRDHDPDAVFVYLADLDSTGHGYGFHPGVPRYVAELEEIDGQVGQILAALRGRESYSREDWLIIVSTDHGGTIDGSHGANIPEHRRIPVIFSGPSAARGRLHTTVNQVDIPVTALAHLGVEPDPAWGLDGRAVGLRGQLPALGRNLVFNGDAEYAPGYPNSNINAGVPGWSDTGGMTVVRYGASGGFPQPEGPGPEGRGRNFFCGGKVNRSQIQQLIDVAALADEIDAGGVRYQLSAWLGGYAEQRDLAWLTLRFLGDHGGELGQATLRPVTVEDRQAHAAGDDAKLTGLLPRRQAGDVPAGTRRLEVSLLTDTASGDNDGYADAIEVVLSQD